MACMVLAATLSVLKVNWKGTPEKVLVGVPDQKKVQSSSVSWISCCGRKLGGKKRAFLPLIRSKAVSRVSLWITSVRMERLRPKAQSLKSPSTAVLESPLLGERSIEPSHWRRSP